MNPNIKPSLAGGAAAVVRVACRLPRLTVIALVVVAALPTAHSAGQHPQMVETAIYMKTKTLDPTLFDGTKLNIHYKYPPQRVNPEVLTQQDGANWAKVFAPDGQQFDALIKRVTKNGHLPELVPPYAARLCVVWADKLPAANTASCEEQVPPGRCTASSTSIRCISNIVRNC